MSNEELREKTLTLTSAEAQQERLINELIQHMIDVELEGFEKILDQHVQAKGIEKTITYIIFPFLERIGILWLTDHINPAQEHLITNIIRQKLIVGIENAITPLSLKAKMLLFLPENEHHEIGLLFLHYLLKSRGVKVIYLGASVPLKDLDYLVELKKPDYIYTHLTTVIKEFNFDKFINNLKQRFPQQQIIISGLMAQTFQKKSVPSNFRFLKSFTEVSEFLGNLS
jgi:methanogenic corrinoid protein MtbC1